MSRKLNSVSVLCALTVLLVAASPAVAQSERAEANRIAVEVQERPTLGCCKCLGGTNTLDLSTVSSNKWTVQGNPAVFLTSIHPLWNMNPGPAKWVSTVASGGTSTVTAGTYDYKLDFVVPACTIGQVVTLTGNDGGDDDIYIYLDNTTNLLSQCSGGWCFNSSHHPLPTFSANVLPGVHTLIVKVVNSGPSPSGMFVNAKLTGTCTSELIKPGKD
jgi:hypothetical protein